MANWGNCDFRELEAFRDKMQRLEEQEAERFCEDCAKELAWKLLKKVIKRTQVGDHSVEVDVTAKRDSKYHSKGDIYKKRINPSGKTGGTLRRGWISKTQEEAESGSGSPQAQDILNYVNGLQISHTGEVYKIELTNPVEYASYYEYGHRQEIGRYVPTLGKRLTKGWVNGNFVLTISEKEIRQSAPAILQQKLEKKLKEVFQ